MYSRQEIIIRPIRWKIEMIYWWWWWSTCYRWSYTFLCVYLVLPRLHTLFMFLGFGKVHKELMNRFNQKNKTIYLNDYLVFSVYISFTTRYREKCLVFDRSMFTEPEGLSCTVYRSNKLGNTVYPNKGTIMCEMMLLFLHASTMIIERKRFVFRFAS
jgi:hypothetical protein